ncbi:MAG: nucleotide exchange factor GrpE [Kiritimatiellaeota bacterium]|nr:nucleotide exchange factor GrpE [Kiritimatiellota bacterium]
MSKNKEKPWSPTAPPEAGKHHSHEGADGGPDKENARRQTPDARPEKTDTEEGGGSRTQAATKDETVKAVQTAPAEAADHAEKLAQLQDRLLRLQADFDNFRKRTLREKNELFDSANQALMLEILPVLDHLQLGIQAASAHQADPAFREGLILIFDQLMGALSKFGLSPVETEKQIFDTNRFEAVNTLPSATEPEGTVLASVRRGYMLRNKLLRPAQVIVSSGPPPEEVKNAE